MHSIRNLSHHYGEQPTFTDLSLEIQQGECVALLGESGCGKSTLLRCIAGLELPSGGEVFINGQSVYSSKGSSISPGKRGIGFVFQDYALFPALTVEQNIAFGISKDQHSRVAELMKLVGVDALKDRLPHQLSGGQQQRVALARSLAPNPSLLLLDEPFSNVDAHRRFEIGEELREILRAHNTSAIFVTHDQTDALSLSDRVAVMTLEEGQGTIAQYDTPENVYTQPACPQVARLTGTAIFLEATASGNSAESILGTVSIQDDASGSGTLMVRPEQLQFVEGDGSAVVKYSSFTGRGFMMSVELGGMRFRVPNAVSIPVGTKGAIDVGSSLIFW